MLKTHPTLKNTLSKDSDKKVLQVFDQDIESKMNVVESLIDDELNT